MAPIHTRTRSAAVNFYLYNKVDQTAKAIGKLIYETALKTIPRGKRKDYVPYWTAELEILHKHLGEARNKMDLVPNDSSTIAHNKARAEYYKKKNELQRQTWHQKTSQLNLEKYTTKLWKLTKSLNGDQTSTASN